VSGSEPGGGPAGLPAGVPTVVAAAGAGARDALERLVAAAQADDPLAPVTVAVPSPYAGLALRRDLARRRGLVNVRFLALARVAELLGAPRLAAAGRAPLTAARRVEAVHTALAAQPGPFAAVAEHPGTDERLAATFAELRRVEPAALATLAARGRRAAAVLALYERFLDLTRDGYDEHDLCLAAAAVADGVPLDELGTVVVHLPRRLSVAEARLVAALAAVDRATVVVAGDDAPSPPRLLSAADPEDEARAILRRVLRRAEAATPLGRMAILYPVRDPYARLVPELLESAGIPWNGPSPARLGDAVAGRVLHGVVELVDADFARDVVATWLASGPVLDRDGRRVPAARWDLVSRAAGVVAGARQWEERLEHHARDLGAELEARRGDDEAEGAVERLERDREQSDRLLAFVHELVERTRPPEPPTWAALAAWAAALLDRYLGGEGKRGDWPERELEAARRIDDVLADLATLDYLGSPVDVPRFRAALATALEAPAAHVGRFGTGVFVGPLRDADGADFDLVAILGGAEGTLPPHGQEDAFLTDADRASAGLLTTADRRVDQRRDYRAALASADTRLVTFPRADPRAQQTRLPARWVLEAARQHAGAPLTADSLVDHDAEPWLDVVGSFEAGVVHDAEPGSLVERDLRALAEWRATRRPVADHPLAALALGQGYALGAARASAGFTAYDGNLGAAPARVDPTAPIAATTLQDWAACPFRFLLGRVLRVRDVPRPEATDTIQPLDEGTLVHSILERFVRERPPAGPDAAWTPADQDRMLEIVEERCADAEARGVTGRPLLWRFAKRRIRRSALRFLTIDAQLRRERQAAPSPDGLEVAFGVGDRAGVAVTLPDRRRVTFRGRIDRVDRSPDGRHVVVYDYKTGRPDRYDALGDDPVDGGQALQLPVYALAATERTGAAEAEAYYWFTRAATADEALTGFGLDESVRARFEEAVTAIVDGIGHGCFPAVPGDRDYNPFAHRETFAHCFTCPYDRLCPLDRGTAFERKSDDPALEPYWRLAADEGAP
jgi:RecB family exonuclease